MITFLDLVFIAISGALLLYGLNRQMNIGMAVFLSVYLVFVLVAHLAWRLGSSVEYSPQYYLIAHMVSLVFFAGCALISVHDGRRNRTILQAINRIRPIPLIVTFLVWLMFQLYLLATYGESGAVRLSATSGMEEVPYFLSSSASLLNAFVGGAALAVAMRHNERGSLENKFLLAAFVVFILYSLAFGAALAGGRRTILILTICFIVARLYNNGRSLSSLMSRHLTALVAATSICLVLASYYQQIRVNVNAPIVKDRLASPDLFKKLEGVELLLTPDLQEDAALRNVDSINRSGPFDFLVSIAEGRYEFGKSSDGVLTLFCIGKALPRQLYPEKPDYDVDLLIAQLFSVAPQQDATIGARFFDNPDYSTTVLALLLGDFGWIGVPAAVLLLTMAMRLSAWAVGSSAANSIVTIGGLGVVFEITTTVEGTLVTLLSSLRTLLIVLIVGRVVRGLSHILAPSTRRRHARST